jgi:predicted dehydrogenase
MSKKMLVSIIGLGHQAIKEYLPIIADSEEHELISVCDINEEILNSISKKYNIKGFNSAEKLLEYQRPDMVIIAIPHKFYLDTIKIFATKGVHIIKEKPFASSMKEAIALDKIIKENNIFLGINLQRRFIPMFIEFKNQIQNIGKIFLIEGVYGLNISKLDEGWRAEYDLARGGALLDMGYHSVDLLIWYMGLPDSITARMSRGNRENQIYDVEDTVNLSFEYHTGKYDEKVLGRFLISRVLPEKKEELKIYGTKGSLKIEKSNLLLLDLNNNIVKKWEFDISKRDIMTKEIMIFSNLIKNNKTNKSHYQEHFQHIAFLEAAYESDKKNTTVKPSIYYKKIKE